jgi:hypothetical protein
VLFIICCAAADGSTNCNGVLVVVALPVVLAAVVLDVVV